MHVIRKEINIFSMTSNHSLNFSVDSTLPDLLPEESLFNDLIYADVPALAITHPDITTLNCRLYQITLDTNTKSLRIDVEKVKRQRLSETVRRVGQSTLRPCPEVTSLRQDVTTIREEQNAVNYYLESEIASMSATTFWSLSKIHHIITLLLPYTMLPPNNNQELIQLLQELAQTLQHFRVEYAVSYI